MRGNKRKSMMSIRSTESIDSDVSLMKDSFICPRHRSLLRRVNFEKEHDMSDDEDWIKSLDDL